VSVTVTTSPARLTRLYGTLARQGGKLIVFTVPNPVACAVWNIGVKDETASTMPKPHSPHSLQTLANCLQDDGVSGLPPRLAWRRRSWESRR